MILSVFRMISFLKFFFADPQHYYLTLPPCTCAQKLLNGVNENKNNPEGIPLKAFNT